MWADDNDAVMQVSYGSHRQKLSSLLVLRSFYLSRDHFEDVFTLCQTGERHCATSILSSHGGGSILSTKATYCARSGRKNVFIFEKKFKAFPGVAIFKTSRCDQRWGREIRMLLISKNLRNGILLKPFAASMRGEINGLQPREKTQILERCDWRCWKVRESFNLWND